MEAVGADQQILSRGAWLVIAPGRAPLVLFTFQLPHLSSAWFWYPEAGVQAGVPCVQQVECDAGILESLLGINFP